MKEKLVSILIPTYNRGKFLEQAINSALSQTYHSIEIVIYDDGSTDNTDNILKQYEDDSRFNIIKSKENKGVGFARNKLLQTARGYYSCWLDSDDIMKKSRVSDSIEFIEQSEYDLIYSNIRWFFQNNAEIEKGDFIVADVSKYDKNIWDSLKFNTTCASAFFKTSLKQYKFVEELSLGGEDILWLWSLLQNDVNIGYLNKCLYLYRRHNDRIGQLKRKEENLKIKERENTKMSTYIKKIKENAINKS